MIDPLENHNLILEIARCVTEDCDKWVFDTVSPYLEEKTEMKVSKRLLERALICFREEHPEEFEKLKKMAEGEE